MTGLERRIFGAISDPGITEGYKGERTLTHWQMDAVMRVLARGSKPDRVETAKTGSIEDESRVRSTSPNPLISGANQ